MMMVEWAQVRWTEARQVAALLGAEPAQLPEASVAPRDHHAALRRDGRREDAVFFLGAALPRLEAIAWAARIVEDEAARLTVVGPDRQALDHALRWLGDPDDARRRAAREAADQAGPRAPEHLLAMAVFFSGGSISLPDLPPVLPPTQAAGKFAAGAIVAAAHRSGTAAAVLDRALDLGEKVADQGTRAISTP